jgi:hypothetical protein
VLTRARDAHPNKRRFSFDELMNLSLERILCLAEAPEPFDVPAPTAQDGWLAADWQEAARAVREQVEGKARGRSHDGAARLNRQTLAFIHDGADVGDRHRLLYSAAKNLGEFGCAFDLAWALLSEAALDSGLQPKEVRRQIECGLNAARIAAPVGARPVRVHERTQGQLYHSCRRPGLLAGRPRVRQSPYHLTDRLGGPGSD